MSELQRVYRLCVCVVMPVNQAKLQKLLQQGDKARIGGKVRCEVGGWCNVLCELMGGCSQGSARRKKKVVHKSATDDKKLQVSRAS